MGLHDKSNKKVREAKYQAQFARTAANKAKRIAKEQQKKKI